MRSIPFIENPASTAELDRPELRIEPKRQVAADLGVSDGGAVGDDPGRHARRYRRQSSASSHRRRSARPDLRLELDEAAQPLRRATGSARVATASAGDDAAFGGRGISSMKVYGPTAINRYVIASGAVTIEGDLRGDAALGEAVKAIHSPPTAQKLPARRQYRRDRRRRSDVRSVRVLRRGDGRGPDDGLYAARAAVRQFPAAGHHPAIAGPLSIACGSIIALLLTAQGAYRCRW